MQTNNGEGALTKQATTHQRLENMPIRFLKGVGPQLADKLKKRDIHNLQDLLFHLPMRYQDRTRITPIHALSHGHHAVVQGVVTHIESRRKPKPSLMIHLSDATGSMQLRFFHFTASQRDNLSIGEYLCCFGEARTFQRNITMVHPEYRKVSSQEQVSMDETLTPIYPTTEGLTQYRLRALTDQALVYLKQGALLTEYLPESLRRQYNLPELQDALLYVHRPPSDAPVNLLEEGQHATQKRLVFEELLAHHLSLKKMRNQVQIHPAYAMTKLGSLREKFIKDLPYTFTGAQQRVAQEVLDDMTQSHPMLRLVQGDVGSGKTVVAAVAALAAVENGYQAAVMAPTEILAEQHMKNFKAWFEPLGIQVAWLASKLKTKEKQEAIESIASGDAQVVVGTHALFQKDVDFAKLGLLVVDEQHRFGVQQRMALRQKGVLDGICPHQLIMSATPIPRTLSMTVYADLDCSFIDELPPGRKPVQTVAIPSEKRQQVIQRVKEACAQGRQSYWVCTLIDESEAIECQAAEVTASELQRLLPEIRVGLVHGRIKPQAKEQAMEAFKKGDIQLLVATTVIEVGVDVPNASLMVIENPERLGLAQLHQLRGRVGRGSVESFCVLLFQPPLSHHGRCRLQVMRESNDGFEIAKKDLELRGPGEVLGTRQTGLTQFRIADLMRDQDLLPKVRDAAQLILQDSESVAEALIWRWLGSNERFVSV